MKSRPPLRRWLALQFALVASVPLAAVAALVWVSLLPQMRADIAIRNQSLARAIASRVSAHLLGADQGLRAVADYISQEGHDDGSFWFDLLDAQAGTGEVFEAIYIANANNEVVSVGLPLSRRAKRQDLIGLDLSRRDFLREARSGQRNVWSETFLSTVSSRLAVALAVPRTQRLVIGEITVERLSEFMHELPIEPGLFTMIVDRQGRIVADSEQGIGGQQTSLDVVSLFKDDSGEDPDASIFEMEGKPYMGSVVSIGEVGWKVLVAQTRQEAFRPITTTLRLVGVGLGLSLLLAVAAGWLQARGIVRHFGRYTEQARAIANGYYDEPWPESRTREFAALAEDLQRMSHAIREREAQRDGAEAALRLSESNLRITLDSIGDAVIATDREGLITRMNPIAEGLTGWRAEKAVGKPLHEVFRIINAFTREPAESPVEKVLDQGQIVGLANHTVLIARDGAEYQIADSGAPIRRPDGDVVGVVLVFRDVTHEYEQARKIRASEQLLKSITANIPGAVYRFHATEGHQYGNTYVSEKAAPLFGLEGNPEEFFKAFAACIPASDIESFMASIHEAVERFAPWQYEGQFIKPNGSRIWFQGISTPHREDDEIVFDGFLMDITDRKAAELELRQLRNYLANIIDSMPSVLVGVDAEGRVTQWNRQAHNTTGLEAAAVLGKPLETVYPLLSDKLAGIKETIRSGTVNVEQKVPRRRNGETHYEDVIIYPLVTNGVEGAVIRVDDVSERVRLEEMMIQSEKMLSVGGLAAGMAHEINNPLAGLLQTAMVLENRLCGDLEANHRAAEAAGISMAAIRSYLDARDLIGLLENIRESGSRAARIVRNMLEFARKSDRAFSSQDLGEVLDDTLDLAASDYSLKKNYDFRKIEIIREYAVDLPKIPCEKSKIQQVLLNILRNGAEAMAENGTWDGHPPRFVLRTSTDGDMARIDIVDNGPGMDEATRRRVFEPFFTTKPVDRGTGLGLSVSYFIVTEDHHGALSVSSSVGSGTTFTIRLPVQGRDPA
ncbi:MAG: PAS domain S-box protein [Syntrophobacteraceae bacterium]